MLRAHEEIRKSQGRKVLRATTQGQKAQMCRGGNGVKSDLLSFINV